MTSKRGYTIEVPLGYQSISATPEYDIYGTGCQSCPAIYVVPQKISKGTSLRSFDAGSVFLLPGQKFANKASAQLSGEPALRYFAKRKLPEGGGTGLLVDYVAIHGGKAWEIYLNPYNPDARTIAEQQAILDLWESTVIPSFSFTK